MRAPIKKVTYWILSNLRSQHKIDGENKSHYYIIRIAQATYKSVQIIITYTTFAL